LNVLDEDGETVLDLCDAPAHDLEDAAPSGITSRCGNWPCTLKLGHSGPCSTSDPAEAATVVQTTPPEGFDEWYAEYGVGESTKDVARLAWNAAFRRTKHFAPATQETPAAGVTEAEVEAAALAIAKRRFGSSVAWPESIEEARAALEAAERVRAAGPKLAYYQTHEPPHCPTCDCAGPNG
jgi:hypothetical protein